ncbi:MAG: hypothetical protein HYU88_14800, partial [Chloroflexi bacterium]|nr:hypothetical protein [Chloroflexota bacterium]
MAAKVILPKLGMNTESATIVRWHKREGDRVAVGDVLVEVETDKATIEVEAETAGVLRKVLAGEQERVSISQTIALIGAADEDVAALVPASRAAAPMQPRHAERVYRAWRGTPPAAPERSLAPDSFSHRPAQPPVATPAPAPTWVRTCQEAGASATAAGDATALPVPGRDSERGRPAFTGQTSSPHPPSPSAEKGPGGEVTRPPRLDPEAIRARLVQRGVLAPPGRAAGPIPPAPIPTCEQGISGSTPHTAPSYAPPNGGSAGGEPGPLALFPTRAGEMPTVGSTEQTGPPAPDGAARA